MTKKLKIYCVTNKEINFLNKTNYLIAWVGKENPPNRYIRCDNEDNIFYKERFYSELTFHYWYWKNKLEKESDDQWIGFCQKRRYWINTTNNTEINTINLNENLLTSLSNIKDETNSIICDSISLSGVKRIKIIKRGWKNLIKDPRILFFKNKQNIELHFDMHHGYGNLFKAINLLDNNDKDDFLKYVRSNTKFNPNIMFIAKKKIIQNWFNSLFPWLERCEKVFGFDNLKGYDTTRLYAFLAERYLSFWFKKYSKFEEKKWILLDFKD